MNSKQVQVGSQYYTKVGREWVRVEVLSHSTATAKNPAGPGPQGWMVDRYRVCRADTCAVLPAFRTARMLRTEEDMMIAERRESAKEQDSLLGRGVL